MAIKVDKITKTINTPDLFLCNRSCKQIGAIQDVSELNIYMSANSVNEITFSVEKETNTDIWDSIETLKVVRAEGYGYFEIAVDKNVSTSTKKVVTGVSLEAELGQLLLFNFSVNGETDRNNDDNWTNGSYVSTTIYNPSDTKHSLLHRMLADKASHWSLGSITSTITINNQEYQTTNEVRTFEWDKKSIYDALMDIEQELDVVFTFTVTANGRRINMYDANKIGSDTSIYIDNENLVNEFTCSSNKDSIKNCFKVVGGDDLINAYIKAVNPNSSDYIYRISDEQMNDMSAELVAKINSYNALYESKRTEYTTICNNLFNAIDNVSLYRDSKTPTRTKVTTIATDEVNKLSTKLSGVTLACKDIGTLTKVGAKKIIKEVAQVCVDYRYEVEISNETLSGSSLTYTIKVSNQTNNDDTAELTNVTTTFTTSESTYYQYIIDNLLSDYSGKGEVNTVAYLESTYKNANPVDYPYCLSELKSYCDAYNTCVVTLQEYSKDTTNSLYSMYYDYWQKWNIMKNAVSKMEEYVDSLIAIQNGYEEQKNAIQKQLDFASYLGNTLYDEFCLYRRDDVYENSNYISDGLSNAECIRMAEKLVTVATKELYKASLPQTTYTTSLNNMFNNPIFEPFYEQFELFNWINAYVDDKLVKLRLIGYKINFDSQDNIEVEFSDNVRNADGLSDLQSLLGQAKSMATSYSSTKQQAQKGNNANTEFTRLKSEGLNSALMNIKSANEEVTMDANGINCKSMDQNGEYDAHQLRITGSDIVMTDDDWKTARMAIGRMTYNGKEIYGVISDAVIGDLIVGNKLNIYNGDKSMSMDKDGLRLTNNVNTIILDPSADNNMLMDMQKNGESIFYVNESGDLYIDGNIYGGSLHLENENGVYVDIDPASSNIMEVGKQGKQNEVDGSWQRESSTGINVTDTYYDNRNEELKRDTSQSNIFTVDGVTYGVFDNIIYKYINNNFVLMCGFSSILPNYKDFSSNFTNSNLRNSIIRRIDEDGYLYIYNQTHADSSYSYCAGSIIKYDIANNKCELFKTMFSDEKNSVFSPFMIGEHVYFKRDGFGVIIYKYSVKTENDKLSYVETISITGASFVVNTFVHKNKIYALCVNSKNKLFIADVTSNESGDIVANLSPDYNYSCYYINDEDNSEYAFGVSFGDYIYVYLVNDIDNNTLTYWKCNIETNTQTIITENINDTMPKISCSAIPSAIEYYRPHNYSRGVYVVPQASKIILFNYISNRIGSMGKTGSYSDLQYLYGDNITFNSPTYISSLEKYCFIEGRKIKYSNLFSRQTKGLDFLSSQQKNFIVKNNKVYTMSSFGGIVPKNISYRVRISGIHNGSSLYDPYNKICVMDSNNDFMVSAVLSLSFSGEIYLNGFIETNSSQYVYFRYYSYGGYCGIGRIDTTDNSVTYYNSTSNAFEEEIPDRGTSHCLKCNREFTYYDELNNTIYAMSLTSLSKVVGFNSSDVAKVASFDFKMLSNIVWANNGCYFVGCVSGSTYKLYYLSLEGDMSVICNVSDEEYDDNIGFSICKYNSYIYVAYSKNGVLNDDYYCVSIDNKQVEQTYKMFKDNGLYLVENAKLPTNGFKTCFLPQLVLDDGIHFFVGSPLFRNVCENGGYRHYLFLPPTNETVIDDFDATVAELPNSITGDCQSWSKNIRNITSYSHGLITYDRDTDTYKYFNKNTYSFSEALDETTSYVLSLHPHKYDSKHISHHASVTINNNLYNIILVSSEEYCYIYKDSELYWSLGDSASNSRNILYVDSNAVYVEHGSGIRKIDFVSKEIVCDYNFDVGDNEDYTFISTGIGNVVYDNKIYFLSEFWQAKIVDDYKESIKGTETYWLSCLDLNSGEVSKVKELSVDLFNHSKSRNYYFVTKNGLVCAFGYSGTEGYTPESMVVTHTKTTDAGKEIDCPSYYGGDYRISPNFFVDGNLLKMWDCLYNINSTIQEVELETASNEILTVSKDGSATFHGSLNVTNDGVKVNINSQDKSSDNVFEIIDMRRNTDVFHVDKNGNGYYSGSLEIGSFKVDNAGNVTLPAGTKISWADIEGTDAVISNINQSTSDAVESLKTEIGENYVTTDKVTANIANLGGWVIESNGFKSTNATDATNIYFYSSAEKTDNKTPILIVKKGEETRLGIYDTGYILGKKLRIENPEGDSSIGKFLFKANRLEGVMEGVDYSNAFESLSDASGDETGEGSETDVDTGEDEVVWTNSESVRNGLQVYANNGSAKSSGLYVGCKSGDGGTIAGFAYSNFWVNLAGDTNTRTLSVYDDVYMYAKTRTGKRSKKKVFRFSNVTDNYYRLKIGNLNETSTYKCELDFTKSSSGSYIQVFAKKFDISNCKTFDRGSATVSGTSDENVKVLYDYDDRYEKFYMNLKPLLYKYNMSDDYHRKHSGFGARAVEQALIGAGLTNEEFGAVCIQKNVTVGIQGGTTKSYDELYGLNYNEFIGLNTYMIQKLYKRIEELEKKIDEAGI